MSWMNGMFLSPIFLSVPARALLLMGLGEVRIL
jgi:hypothetical protein